MMSADRRVLSVRLLAQIGAWGALVAALGASLYLAMAPVYVSASASATVAAGSPAEAAAPIRLDHNTATLIDVNGSIAFLWFGVTTVLAALPVVFRRTRFARPAATISAVFLPAFVVLGIASIGVAYVPAAGFALLAAAVTPAWRPAT